MKSIYTSGSYLEVTRTWHAEDAPWKAAQIKKIIDKNQLKPKNIAEIGCGSGVILDQLSKLPDLQDVYFVGYDISPQAIEMAKQLNNEKVHFFKEDILSNSSKIFDLLLVIDVFEHVPDYIGFVSKCRTRARHKIYHIPLDIHVSSVLRDAYMANRYSIGHIHYFTASSAVSTLRDTGHEIIDLCYTNGAFGVFTEHPRCKTALANVARWLCSKISLALTARLLGGYSLLVLTK